MTRALVYRYAVGYRSDFDAIAMAQLRMAHDLHNDLVALSLHREEAKREVWREDLVVDQAAAAIDELVERRDATADCWRQSKIASKDRKGNLDIRASLDVVKRELLAARLAHSEAQTIAFEALQQRFIELAEIEQAQVKVLYADYVQTRGLYWATFNLVRIEWLRSTKALTNARQAGVATKLRFRHWHGTGSLAVQLQRPNGAPQRTPDMLASSTSKWHNSVRLPAQRINKHRSPLFIRAGSTEDGPLCQPSLGQFLT